MVALPFSDHPFRPFSWESFCRNLLKNLVLRGIVLPLYPHAHLLFLPHQFLISLTELQGLSSSLSKLVIPPPQSGSAASSPTVPSPSSSLSGHLFPLPPDFSISTAGSISSVRKLLEASLFSSAAKIPKAHIEIVLVSFRRVEQLYSSAQK